MLGRRRKHATVTGPLAAMAVEEAAAAGFAGQVTFDPAGPALELEGIGRLDVAAAFRRAGELDGRRQRDYVKGTVRRFLRDSVPLPARYQSAPPELAARIRTHLEREARSPDSPVPQEQLGRAERALTIDGWQTRIRRAAESYEAWWDCDRGNVGPLLSAAAMWWLLGAGDRARPLAQEVLDAVGADPYRASDRCAALVLGGDRPGLAAQQTLDSDGRGPRWAPIVAAAAAAEAGDVEALRREIDAWRPLAEDEWVDTNGLNPSDRDLMEILERWLADV